MILTSVDFPAPLSPTSATTSPGKTLIETSLRACTAPNLLPIPVSASTGSLPVAMMVTLFQNSAGGKHGGRATGWPALHVLRQLRPALAHASAKSPVQTSSTL